MTGGTWEPSKYLLDEPSRGRALLEPRQGSWSLAEGKGQQGGQPGWKTARQGRLERQEVKDEPDHVGTVTKTLVSLNKKGRPSS